MSGLRPLRRLAAAALVALALPAGAQLIQSDDEPHPPKQLPPEMRQAPETQPWPIRLLMNPLEHGMFVHLPVVDTDPNRGVTWGVMPIWVLQDEGGTRIHSIHAPSITYNDIFKVIPTYRYYRYPNDKASDEFRASWSLKSEREVYAAMQDLDFLGRGLAVHGEAQYNIDGSGRFFGRGPDSSKAAETNFERKTLQYTWRVGLPLLHDSGLRFNVAHHLAGEEIGPGPITSLPNINDRFPHVATHWHQNGELQLFVDYDTRDDAVTTRQGAYLKGLVENSQHAWGSEYSFQRYQVDLRGFLPTGKSGDYVTAGRVLFEHEVGSVPFYLLPQLGGKYVHRGYGEGRYVEQALWTGSVEERVTMYKIPLAGVVTEFEVAPYFELGSVARSPHRFSDRYARPVVGSAVRAIARPQVVGSIDVGVGQEGPRVFMDINYSF